MSYSDPISSPYNPMQVLVVRIPEHRIEELRVLAAGKNILPGMLLAQWALEKLDQLSGTGI